MNIDKAFEYLKKGLASGRLAHSYVVTAPPRGDGLLLAERVYQLLFCDDPGRGCGKCKGCRQVSEHTHPDLLWVEPQKKSRIISIDQIRELQKRIRKTSFAGGWKGCVLVGADRMPAPAANAFLKTLEEPPAKSLIFLLTEKGFILLIW